MPKRNATEFVPWDRHSIKAEIGRRGMSLSQIASEARLHQSRLSRGLLGADRRGAEVIAEALGIDFDLLFPGLYLNKSRRTEESEQVANGRARAKANTKTDKERSAA